ncbi:tetratricopeptide repeat protein [Nannocystis pusilla]|uniref:tetratricopeptide repeat protein n=1 Tax=Nannocystis pusilla TaxID=889268 RepID=UPI003B773FD9
MSRALARLALACVLFAPAAASAAPWDMPLRAGLFAPVPSSMSLRSPANAALLTPAPGPLSLRPGATAALAPVPGAMSLRTSAAPLPTALRSPVLAAPGPRVAAPAADAAPSGDASRLLSDAEDAIKAAEQVTPTPAGPSASDLAERLVAGQVQLEGGDAEGAAIVFLDLLENAPGTPAAVQARYYLGEALLQLRMRRWASECFSSPSPTPAPRRGASTSAASPACSSWPRPPAPAATRASRACRSCPSCAPACSRSASTATAAPAASSARSTSPACAAGSPQSRPTSGSPSCATPGAASCFCRRSTARR